MEIKLTEQEVNGIIDSLGEAPMKHVDGAVSFLRMKVLEAQQPQQEQIPAPKKVK